jgi:hypothetical protein
MTLDNFLNQAWTDHATDAKGVAQRLPQALALLTENKQIPGLVHLAAHVFGEHLAQWEQGIEFLQQIQKQSVFEPQTESQIIIDRNVASLKMASGARLDLQSFGKSDQIQIYASAAAGLAMHEATQALGYLEKALALAQDLDITDPANRALAVKGNNMAAALEEKENRSSQENDLMIRAAQIGRKFWEIAGTWLHVERAEYRLAMSYLKSGQPEQASEHAQLCLNVVEQNKAEPMEYFFGYEAAAWVEKARGNAAAFQQAVQSAEKYFELMSEADKPWCQATMNRLRAKS